MGPSLLPRQVPTVTVKLSPRTNGPKLSGPKDRGLCAKGPRDRGIYRLKFLLFIAGRRVILNVSPGRGTA